MKMPMQIILLAAVVCTVVAAVWVLHPPIEPRETHETEVFYYSVTMEDVWLEKEYGRLVTGEKVTISIDHACESHVEVYWYEEGKSNPSEVLYLDELPYSTTYSWNFYPGEWSEGKVRTLNYTPVCDEKWVVLKKV